MVFGGGDVGQVLVAALGDEVGLGDHRDSEVFEIGDAVVGHHGRVFDAVLRVCARIAQRRERDDELDGRHAVHRDRGVGGVAFGDPGGQFVEVEVAVVQDALARRQAVHALTQFAVPVRLDQLHDVTDFEVGRGVGDAGDTVLAEPTADLGQSAFAALQRV